jgi:hypothetical protein
MKFIKHVVFVAPEISPNITPLLDSRMTAETVYLVYTKDLEHLADRLVDFYKTRNIKTVKCLIADAFDLVAIHVALEKIKLDNQNSLNQLAFNITSGTKLMAIAVTQCFSDTEAGIYYLLPNDELIWLNPVHQPSYNLQDKIKLNEFLTAHGATKIQIDSFSAQHAKRNHQIVDLLEQHVVKFNRYKAFTKTVSKLLANNGVVHAPNTLLPLFKDLQKKGVNIQIKQNQITLNETPHIKKLLSGQWFEVYIYLALQRLKQVIPEIQDIQFGVKIHTGERIVDEIDVVFLANNKLFAIECKSGTVASINHHLQRMDSLSKKLGGVMAQGALITTAKLENKGGFSLKAKQLKIALIHQQDLQQLQNHLKRWILQSM